MLFGLCTLNMNNNEFSSSQELKHETFTVTPTSGKNSNIQFYTF